MFFQSSLLVLFREFSTCGSLGLLAYSTDSFEKCWLTGFAMLLVV
jgi:hypothetical protein